MMRRLALAFTLAAAGCKDDIGEDLALSRGNVFVAPTNLAGVIQDGGIGILLTWDDNSTAETGYRLDVSNAPMDGTPVPTGAYLPADTTTYVYPTQPGNTYYCQVVAVTATLQSDPSNEISIVVPNFPLTPRSFTATTVGPDAVDLAWIDILGETSYKIERSVDSGATWIPIVTLPADTRRHSDTGLAPDVKYCYRVRAVNAEGEGAPSSTACATTQTVQTTVSAISTEGDVGQYASLASAGGVEHVSHYDATYGDVVYTTGSAATSHATLTVDRGPTGREDVGKTGTSLALDGAGFIHIAAEDATNLQLRYVTNVTGRFVASTVPDPEGGGRRPTVRVSPADGSLQIAYFTERFHLNRAVWNGSTWSFETMVTLRYYASYYAFALDPAGLPHVVYPRANGVTDYELVHVWKDGASWREELVKAGDRPARTSLAADPAGALHVSYYDNNKFRLMYATNASGRWTTEVVHEEASTGFGKYHAIAVGPTGRVHVAYSGTARSELRYARRDPGGPWTLRLIDPDGRVGSDISIALDGAEVVIAYYRATSGDLERARGAP